MRSRVEGGEHPAAVCGHPVCRHAAMRASHIRDRGLARATPHELISRQVEGHQPVLVQRQVEAASGRPVSKEELF